MSSDTTVVMGDKLNETDLAILLDSDGEEVWIPKSQIKDEYEEDGLLCLEIPEWLAIEKGLA